MRNVFVDHPVRFIGICLVLTTTRAIELAAGVDLKKESEQLEALKQAIYQYKLEKLEELGSHAELTESEAFLHTLEELEELSHLERVAQKTEAIIMHAMDLLNAGIRTSQSKTKKRKTVRFADAPSQEKPQKELLITYRDDFFEGAQPVHQYVDVAS